MSDNYMFNISNKEDEDFKLRGNKNTYELYWKYYRLINNLYDIVKKENQSNEEVIKIITNIDDAKWLEGQLENRELSSIPETMEELEKKRREIEEYIARLKNDSPYYSKGERED